MVERLIQYPGIEVQKAALVDLDLSMLFMLGLFLVFFVILNKTFIQPMLQVFEKRHELTDGARDAAQAAVRRSEERIRTYEQRLGDTRRQAVARQKQLKQEGLDRERETLDAVRTEVDGEVARGLSELQATRQTAEANLRTATRDLGERIVKKILGGPA